MNCIAFTLSSERNFVWRKGYLYTECTLSCLNGCQIWVISWQNSRNWFKCLQQFIKNSKEPINNDLAYYTAFSQVKVSFSHLSVLIQETFVTRVISIPFSRYGDTGRHDKTTTRFSIASYQCLSKRKWKIHVIINSGPLFCSNTSPFPFNNWEKKKIMMETLSHNAFLSLLS